MGIYRHPKRTLFKIMGRVILLLFFFISPNPFFPEKKVASKDAVPLSATGHFQLGINYLEAGNRSGAISEWRQYILLDPESADTRTIRKYLTLLVREESEAYAKEAVLNEKALSGGRAPKNTIAVTPFINLGSQTLSPLGKGMAAMLIHDLSQVPDLQVIERIKVQALLQEIHLAASGLTAPETTPKVGNLLKARHVATGSLTDPNKNDLHIVAVVSDIERPEDIATQEAQGGLAEFYDLEKRLACDIIVYLGRDCDSMPSAFHKIHTKSLKAFTFWANGLDALDRGRFTDAEKWFQKAVEEDPTFDLAKDSLMSTPPPEMSSMTALQIVSSLSGDGITDGGEAPWKSVYRSHVEKNLREAVSLAFIAGKNQRACDCLNMALEMGYNPYVVLKTIFEVGNELELDSLCECASAAGVMKAVFAKAARDAVSTPGRSVYDVAQIAQCRCLRGEAGLAYTPPDENALPPDPKIPDRTVSTIIP